MNDETIYVIIYVKQLMLFMNDKAIMLSNLCLSLVIVNE